MGRSRFLSGLAEEPEEQIQDLLSGTMFNDDTKMKMVMVKAELVQGEG